LKSGLLMCAFGHETWPRGHEKGARRPLSVGVV